MSRGSGVAFVIPYLGRWPRWSALFFESVASNPCVDFLLICDAEPSFPLPQNVAVIHATKDELRERLARATGLEINRISGHKLCDFKPFFGACFADYLKCYEFWGFCDIDIMFGDLSKLLEPQFLSQLDVFTAHNDRIVGHFTILRNSALVNGAAFEIEGWQAKCLEPQTMQVDELYFQKALESHAEIRWGRPDSLPEELRRPFCRFGITFGFGGEVAHHGGEALAVVEWECGKVFYCGIAGPTTEVLYVHFMGLKRWWHWIFFGSRGGLQGPHRFSRIGYGGPTSASGLNRSPWRQVHALQNLLQETKSLFGGLSRKFLPAKAFLRMRRSIFGRGRY